MISRRGFLGTGTATLAALACPLPEAFLADVRNASHAKRVLDGWVTLLRPGIVPADKIRGSAFEVTEAMIQEMVTNFTEPVPLSEDFGDKSVGWVSEIAHLQGALLARLELPSFGRKIAEHYQWVVPAFVMRYRETTGTVVGTKLVMAALTNAPANAAMHT